MKKIAIYASDGTNSLIDPETQKIAIIGFKHYDSYEHYLPDEKIRPLKKIELFFDTDFSDYFFFSEEGKLLFNCISERRKRFERKLYQEATKVAGIDCNVFLNHIAANWSGFKLGFFDESVFVS